MLTGAADCHAAVKEDDGKKVQLLRVVHVPDVGALTWRRDEDRCESADLCW